MIDEDYRFILEALEKADRFFTSRDVMNSAVHCELPRLSPITKLVKVAIERLKDGEK
jgi:hypothetical protein